MIVNCDSCQTPYDVDETQVPPNGLAIRCSVCNHDFVVGNTPAPSEPHVAFFVQRSSGNVFGPFAPPIIASMLQQGKLDGSESVSIDKVSWTPIATTPELAPHVATTASADLPGLPVDDAPLPGLPGALPDLSDLPGLPSGAGTAPPPPPPPPGGGIDLAGFDLGAPTDGAVDLPAPAGVTDLPAPVAEGSVDLPMPAGGNTPPPFAGLPSAADVPLGAPPPPPTDFADLPAPASPGSIDLPMPVGASGLDELGAGGVEQPDLVAPAGGVDLVAPAAAVDLPQPAAGIDLPQPAASIDLPAPSSGVDVPMPAGSVDLPVPAGAMDELQKLGSMSGELPGGTIDVPMPVGGNVDVVAPVIGNQDGVVSIPGAGVPDAAATPPGPETAASGLRGLLQGKLKLPVLVGGGIVALALVATGLHFAGVFGGGGGGGGRGNQPSKATQLSDDASQLLAGDTFYGYRTAEKAFEKLAKADPENSTPKALRIQALVARIVRFGDDQASLDIAKSLIKATEATEEPPVELRVARGMLPLTEEKPGDAVNQLKSLSDSNPKHARAAVFLAWAQMAIRQYAEAQTSLKRALAAQGNMAAALFSMAQALAATKKPEEAIDYANKTLSANPKHASALLLKATLLKQLKRADEAQSELKKLFAIPNKESPPHAELSKAHQLIASILQDGGKIDEARKHYEIAIQADAKNADAQLALGRISLMAREFHKAEGFFQAAKEAEPKNIEAGMLLAETILALGKPLNARTTLQAMLKDNPKSAKLHYTLGHVEESIKEEASAIEHYNKAIELEGKYFPPYKALAGLYVKRKKIPLALATLEQAKTELPGAQVRNAIGETYAAIGELGKARTKFEEAIALDEKFNPALFNLADVMLRLGQLDAAEKHYNTLRQRDSRFPGLAESVAQLHVRREDYDKASQEFTTALQTGTPSVDLRLAAGKAYVLAQEYDKALEQVKQILLEQPTSGPARALRADAYLGQKKVDKALSEIQQTIEREERWEYFEIMSRIELARKDTLKAIEALTKAIKLVPENLDLLERRANLRIRNGAVADGLKDTETILKSTPKKPQILLLKALALADLGKEKEATATFKQTIKLDDRMGEAHFRIGQTATDSRDFKTAYTHLKKAGEYGDPKSHWYADALFALARTAEQVKKQDQAIAAYKKFLKSAPANHSTRADAEAALERLAPSKRSFGSAAE